MMVRNTVIIARAQWRIQDLAKGGGGGPWRAPPRLNGGLRAEPPVGSRGRAHGGGSRGEPPLRAKPPEAESFLYIFIQKKWPKVEDLSEICVKICPRV